MIIIFEFVIIVHNPFALFIGLEIVEFYNGLAIKTFYYKVQKDAKCIVLQFFYSAQVILWNTSTVHNTVEYSSRSKEKKTSDHTPNELKIKYGFKNVELLEAVGVVVSN